MSDSVEVRFWRGQQFISDSFGDHFDPDKLSQIIAKLPFFEDGDRVVQVTYDPDGELSDIRLVGVVDGILVRPWRKKE